MDWIQTSEAQDFIEQMSKEMVAEFAPEEMDMIDELLSDYFQNPDPPDLQFDVSEDPLGFGINELLIATTPAAAAMASAALSFLLGIMLTVSADVSSEIVRSKIRQLLSSSESGMEDKPHLSPDQLEQIQQVTIRAATQYGMDIIQAQQMSNALIVKLVLPSDSPANNVTIRKIKILFLAASPRNATPLTLDDEMRAIDQALRGGDFRDRFELIQHWAVRVTDLQELLLRHKPDIVHFSGHGSRSGEIVLENDFGNAQPVSAEALSTLFHVLQDNIRCVIMNACFSITQANAIADAIDCVIGMSDSIGDRTSLNFAAAFYQGLAFGRDVQTAFDLGISRLKLEGQISQAHLPRLLAHRSRPTEIFFVNNSSIPD